MEHFRISRKVFSLHIMMFRSSNLIGVQMVHICRQSFKKFDVCVCLEIEHIYKNEAMKTCLLLFSSTYYTFFHIPFARISVRSSCYSTYCHTEGYDLYTENHRLWREIYLEINEYSGVDSTIYGVLKEHVFNIF